MKKEQEVLDFQCQLSRNMKLKSDYDKKIDQIKILKAYYLKCLHNKSYKCLDQGIAGPSSDYPDSTLSIATMPSRAVSQAVISSDKSAAFSSTPMVTIKYELADEFTNVKTEVEDNQ